MSVVLISSDNEKFTLPLRLAFLSGFIRNTFSKLNQNFNDDYDSDSDDDNDDPNYNKFALTPEIKAEVEELEKDGEHRELFLEKVDSKNLKLIVEFLEYNDKEPIKKISTPLKSNEMKKVTSEWYANYIDKLGVFEVRDLVKISDYLSIMPLRMLCAAKFSTFISDKTLEELASTFGVSTTLTPEEEAEVKKEEEAKNKEESNKKEVVEVN